MIRRRWFSPSLFSGTEKSSQKLNSLPLRRYSVRSIIKDGPDFTKVLTIDIAPINRNWEGYLDPRYPDTDVRIVTVLDTESIPQALFNARGVVPDAIRQILQEPIPSAWHQVGMRSKRGCWDNGTVWQSRG